jgi:hypothetical protein
MTPEQFRRMALKLPEAVEMAHMSHPDFRTHGRIFATLGPDSDRAMVKLSPEEQRWFMGREPKVFRPAAGAWGIRGSTLISLRNAKVGTVREALGAAWHCASKAPPRKARTP